MSITNMIRAATKVGGERIYAPDLVLRAKEICGSSVLLGAWFSWSHLSRLQCNHIFVDFFFPINAPHYVEEYFDVTETLVMFELCHLDVLPDRLNSNELLVPHWDNVWD